MLEINAIKELYLEDGAKDISDFASLIKVMKNELEKANGEGRLREIELEIICKIEWLKARSRMSEVSLTVANVSLMLSVVAILFQIFATAYGAATTIASVVILTGVIVLTLVHAIHQSILHKKECNLLAYYSLRLELIKELSNARSESVAEFDTNKQNKRIRVGVRKKVSAKGTS